MVQNHVAPYVPCELMGTLLYYGAWDIKNLFWLLQGQQPFEFIPPLMPLFEFTTIKAIWLLLFVFLRQKANTGNAKMRKKYGFIMEVSMVFAPYTVSLSMQNFTMNNHALEMEHYNVWP
jgi:hypothetical protein